MKFNKHSYDVSAEVTFTGRDLFLMQECCSMHYDAKTRSIFEPTNPHPDPTRGFGYGWCVRMAWDVEPDFDHPDAECLRLVGYRHPVATTEVTVSTCQLDALMKGLEMGHSLKLDGKDAVALSGSLRQLFFQLQEEWKRLNYTPYEIKVLDEQTNADGRKVLTVAKGTAHVEHKVLHGGALYQVIAFGARTDDHTALVVRPIEVDEQNRVQV